MEGKTDVVALLLKHKASVDAATNNGATPLYAAALSRRARDLSPAHRSTLRDNAGARTARESRGTN